eukprot:132682-Alexandrium_andersonii.AAC.1
MAEPALHFPVWACNVGAVRKGGRWKARVRNYEAVVRGRYERHALRFDAVDFGQLNALLRRPCDRKDP